MQATLRRAGWRFISVLAAVLGSQTLALAQFSTAIPTVKEKELAPPTPPVVLPISLPPSTASESVPAKKKAAPEVERPRWPRLPARSPDRDESPAATPTAPKTIAPRPVVSPSAKSQITPVAHRVVVTSAGPAGSSIVPVRAGGITRIPDIRLRPIGVIPPEGP